MRIVQLYIIKTTFPWVISFFFCLPNVQDRINVELMQILQQRDTIAFFFFFLIPDFNEHVF